MALSHDLIVRGRPAWGALALLLCGCGAPEPREATWRLLSQEGRTLRIEVEAGGPPCDAITRVDVQERRDAVDVTVHAGPQPDADCGPGVAAVLGRFPVTVRLREPLGTRELR